MILVRLRDAVGKVLRKNSVILGRKEDALAKLYLLQLLAGFRLKKEKRLNHQTPLVLNFTDFEPDFDSADIKTTVKVLYLDGISDKCIKMASTMYKKKNQCS